MKTACRLDDSRHFFETVKADAAFRRGNSKGRRTPPSEEDRFEPGAGGPNTRPMDLRIGSAVCSLLIRERTDHCFWLLYDTRFVESTRRWLVESTGFSAFCRIEFSSALMFTLRCSRSIRIDRYFNVHALQCFNTCISWPVFQYHNILTCCAGMTCRARREFFLSQNY